MKMKIIKAKSTSYDLDNISPKKVETNIHNRANSSNNIHSPHVKPINSNNIYPSHGVSAFNINCNIDQLNKLTFSSIVYIEN